MIGQDRQRQYIVTPKISMRGKLFSIGIIAPTINMRTFLDLPLQLRIDRRRFIGRQHRADPTQAVETGSDYRERDAGMSESIAEQIYSLYKSDIA
jgi:hypothetical protein